MCIYIYIYIYESSRRRRATIPRKTLRKSRPAPDALGISPPPQLSHIVLCYVMSYYIILSYIILYHSILHDMT